MERMRNRMPTRDLLTELLFWSVSFRLGFCTAASSLRRQEVEIMAIPSLASTSLNPPTRHPLGHLADLLPSLFVTFTLPAINYPWHDYMSYGNNSFPSAQLTMSGSRTILPHRSSSTNVTWTASSGPVEKAEFGIRPKIFMCGVTGIFLPTFFSAAFADSF